MSANETKWTQGPWRRDPKSYTTVQGADGRSICNGGNNRSRSLDENQANAHLIAAAPELYAALLECLECEFAVTEKTTIDRARAALAKARGEAS